MGRWETIAVDGRWVKEESVPYQKCKHCKEYAYRKIRVVEVVPESFLAKLTSGVLGETSSQVRYSEFQCRNCHCMDRNGGNSEIEV